MYVCMYVEMKPFNVANPTKLSSLNIFSLVAEKSLLVFLADWGIQSIKTLLTDIGQIIGDLMVDLFGEIPNFIECGEFL